MARVFTSRDYELSVVLGQVLKNAIRQARGLGLSGVGAGLCRDGLAYAAPVRLVIARCSVDYLGRLTAHLPLATRLLVVKADGSVLVHSDGGSYKPLNWMSPPCTLASSPRLPDGPASGR